jgi:hypothetical protein
MFLVVACVCAPATARAAIPGPLPESTGQVRVLSPGASVASALNAATPGQRIQLRAGTYTGNVEARPRGTSTAPVTLESYPGEVAHIRGGFKLNGAAWTRVRNLRLGGTASSPLNSWGTSIWSGTNVAYENLDIGYYRGGYSNQGILLKTGNTGIQLRGNRIHHLGTWTDHDHGV